MKVVLAINSDVGKPGKIGVRTYMIAKACMQKNLLKKIFCRGIAIRDISRSYFFVPPFQKILSLLARAISLRSSSINLQLRVQNKTLGIFDFWTRNHMPVCNIFHAWDYLEGSFKKAKKQGSITVLDIQMAPVLYVDKKPTPYTKAPYLKYPELIDYFIAPSKFTKDILLRLGILEKKIAVVPFGVDIEKFKPGLSQKKKFVCLFVGTLCERKGTNDLLQAWKELGLLDTELVLCGNVKKEFSSTLKKYQGELKNIRLPGQIHGDELLQEYQRASVFVFPSLVEGSAKVTYEALACGLPVITTDNAGSVVKDGESGFIVPAINTSTLKEKIKYLYDHPEIIKKMSSAARKNAEAYSWDTYGKNVVSIYEKIYKAHTN